MIFSLVGLFWFVEVLFENWESLRARRVMTRSSPSKRRRSDPASVDVDTSAPTTVD